MYPRRLSWIYRRYRIPDPSYAIEVDPDIESKMLRDPDIAFLMQHRQMLVGGTGYHVDPGTNKADEKQVLRAQIEQDCISHIERFDESRRITAYADMSGARGSQIQGVVKRLNIGDGTDRTWAVPVRLVDMAKEDFRHVNTAAMEGPANTVEIQQQVWSIGRMGYHELTNPQDYIIHRVGNREEYAQYGHGLREALAYLWFAKSHLFQTLAETSDRLGEGWVKVKIQTGGIATDEAFSNSEVYQDTLRRIEALRGGGAIVLADDEEADLMEASGTGFKMVLEHYRLLQQMCSRLILGAVMPTGGDMEGGSGGSYNKATVEKSSTQAIVGTSRKALEESYSTHLMAWIEHYNRANFEELGLTNTPRGVLRIDDDDALSPQESIEFYGSILDRGVPVMADELYEALGISRPEGVPDVIEGSASIQQAAAQMELELAETGSEPDGE